MPNFYVSSKFYVKEIKGKYYVYVIEKGQDGKERQTYVGALDKIIETYMGVLGGNPLIKCRGRDLNPGHGLERPAYYRRIKLDRAVLPRRDILSPMN
ncbi:integrase [Sulfolobus acidocaldarius SUSAZ]|nr:integrase [Sulfolobus acidocaldarius SUSAZ]